MEKRTSKVVGLALLTALIVILQALAKLIPLVPFSLTLSLIPIVIGAALYGIGGGAWLGFVFGAMTLFDAGAFLAVSVPGTLITVLVKGTVCGIAAAAVYLLLRKVHDVLAVAVAAVVCPCVNTGIFLIGCRLFFMPTITEWSAASGYPNAGNYLIFGMIGINFIIEMAINLILSPAIVRIIHARNSGS